MILRHPALEKITLTEDLGRDFLYARHNADLANLNPEQAAKLDSIAHIDGLARIGCKLAGEVPSDHFMPFVS